MAALAPDDDELEGSLSDSDISLTSTVQSEPQDEYDVDCIVAETVTDDGDKRYLVKWQGYDHHRNTWEGLTSFNGRTPLDNWEFSQTEIAKGLKEPFNVEEWEKGQRQLAEESQRRKALRRTKRRKLALADQDKSAPPTTTTTSALFSEDKGPGRPRRPRDQEETMGKKKPDPNVRSFATATDAIRNLNAPRSERPPDLSQMDFIDPRSGAEEPRVREFYNRRKSIHDAPEYRPRQPHESTRPHGPQQDPEEHEPDRPYRRPSDQEGYDQSRPHSRPSNQERYDRGRTLHRPPLQGGLEGSNQHQTVGSFNAPAALSNIFGAVRPDNPVHPSARPPPSPSPPPMPIGGPVTCFFWAEQQRGRGFGCLKGADCKYLHEDTGNIAAPPPNYDPSLDVRPNHPKPEALTCFYWYQGHIGKGEGCRFTEETCRFFHRNTGLVGNPLTKKSMRVPMDTPALPLVQPPKDPHFNPPSGPESLAQLNKQLRNDSGASHDPRLPEVPFNAIRLLLDISGTENDGQTCEVAISGIPFSNRPVFSSTAEECAKSLNIDTSTGKCLSIKITCPGSEYREKHLTSKLSDMCEIIPTSTASVATLEGLAKYLRRNSCAALVLQDSFALAIFPLSQREWKSFASPSLATSHAALGCHFRDPIMFHMPLINYPEGVTAPEKKVADLLSKLFKIEDHMIFFKWYTGELLDKNVFVMVDLDDSNERLKKDLDLMSRYFHALGARCFHVGLPTSWDYWLRYVESGCVVLHPAQWKYHRIPKLADLLLSATKKINFIEIGRDIFSPNFSSSSGGIPPHITYRHLFLTGAAIMVTDDLFEDHPADAFSIIEAFLQTQNALPKWRRQYNKIAARPDLKAWCLELADKDKGKNLNIRLKTFDRVSFFIQPEIKYKHGKPSKDAQIVEIEAVGDHAEHWKRDPTEATDWLVVQFAVWTSFNADKHRKFVVVHGPGWEPKCPEDHQNIRFMDSDMALREILPVNKRAQSSRKGAEAASGAG
ncbi:uncharacterized protein K452DRAFT_355495 [Aplosporella prunicola CBS 121167]|uniref:Chromo domain-containing protein n=1 Tax=Aplosporella prunicola CBS 121167 TaxID=1176127 RepID=A0A6A6BQJ1_9PEZI|nr:uncharacterized protein K452DRAFT_355495 [Aplosporella prunicola CBS 121167]KAF2146018.1 hypothetical protein K452DRAFT_355495 [Aplosporella prunicola CBS 121167]